MTETPTHEYETTTGTEAVPFASHEPRTVKHTVTNSSPESVAAQAAELYMMIEIGDGVFVQFGTCAKCSKRVSACKCTGGPQEPEYVTRWREQRFERSFDTRPDPTHTEIPSVVKFLKDRGYTVTKKGQKQTIEEVAADQGVGVPDLDDLAIPDLTETERDDMMDALAQNEGVDPEKVDEGLDAALEKVKAARLDVDFPEF